MISLILVARYVALALFSRDTVAEIGFIELLIAPLACFYYYYW